jgi:SAM-dependent MidA family methyltransferase
VSLSERIRHEIREHGPMPFARFMEWALYDPDDGYYAGGGSRLGPDRDFYTASDVGRAFGGTVARQLRQIDRAIGPFDPFHVVEFGSGRGRLARDILDEIGRLDRELASRLRYVMVDRSRAMLDEARRTVPEAECLTPDELGTGYRGTVLAVELFDALPVHRVRRRNGELVEVFVGLDDAEELAELERPCTPVARSFAARYGAAAEEGSEAEVAPRVDDELDRMHRALERGVVLVVDYGERAEQLYGPARPEGTLLAYRRHRTSQEYLQRIGEQDLTAHVNFSALEDRARSLGLETLGFTTQDRFLIANGILDAFRPDEPDRLHDPRRVKARLQALQLIHPDGMGRRFKVLALAKGCRPDLDGLRDPFAARGASGSPRRP